MNYELNLHPCLLQVYAFGSKRAMSPDHHHTLAKESLTFTVLKPFHRSLASVVYTYYLKIACGLEEHLVLSPRT